MWAEGTAAALLYGILLLAFAYPLSLRPATHVLYAGADTNLLLWTMMWDAHALTRAPLAIFDANIFHPFRFTLAYSENMIGSAIIAAPVLWASGNPVLALNVVSLLSCILCGTGTYVLARRLGVGPLGAALGGFIFAFAPPRFLRIGQLHLTTVQWVPFCLAFAHGYLESGRRRDAWGACAFFVLQMLTSGHGAVFAVLALAALAVSHVVSREPTFDRLRGLVLPGAVTLAISVAVFLPYLAVQRDVGLSRPLEESYAFSPNLVSFIASPSHLHAYLLGLVIDPKVLQGASAFLFPGCLTLALAIVAVWVAVTRRRRDLALYAVLALVSVWLSLGPAFGLYRLVYDWPGISFVRVPSRFSIVTLLALAVLAAAGFDHLTACVGARTRATLALAAGLLLIAEYYAAPLNARPYAVTIPAVDRWLDTRPRPFVVAELPLPASSAPARQNLRHSVFMLHSAAHFQKTIHGYSGFQPEFHRRLYETLYGFPAEDGLAALARLGVTYVVIHEDMYSPEQWPGIEEKLRGLSGWLTLEHREPAARVYSLRPKS